MTQQEQLIYLIKYLILESREYKNIEIPLPMQLMSVLIWEKESTRMILNNSQFA